MKGKIKFPILGIRAENYSVENWSIVSGTNYCDVNVAIINEQILTRGTVLIFLQTLDGTYISLPQRALGYKGVTINIDSVYTFRQVRILWEYVNESYSFRPPDLIIKVIALPPGIQDKFPTIDLCVFDNVSRLFNIPH